LTKESGFRINPAAHAPSELESNYFRKHKKTNMKKIIILAAVSFMLTTTASAQIRKDGPGLRDENRRERQGIRSGEITRGEAFRIGKEKRDYRQAVSRASADGRITPRERVNIKRQDRQVDRSIFRSKHNCRKRS
jgi:hypothetical protein